MSDRVTSGVVTVEFIRQAEPTTRVMNEHTNDHDLCAVCGSAWPCERVVLADHASVFGRP